MLSIPDTTTKELRLLRQRDTHSNWIAQSPVPGMDALDAAMPAERSSRHQIRTGSSRRSSPRRPENLDLSAPTFFLGRSRRPIEICLSAPHACETTAGGGSRCPPSPVEPTGRHRRAPRRVGARSALGGTVDSAYPFRRPRERAVGRLVDDRRYRAALALLGRESGQRMVCSPVGRPPTCDGSHRVGGRRRPGISRRVPSRRAAFRTAAVRERRCGGTTSIWLGRRHRWTLDLAPEILGSGQGYRWPHEAFAVGAADSSASNSFIGAMHGPSESGVALERSTD